MAISMPRFQLTTVSLAIFFVALRLTAGALLKNNHNASLFGCEGEEVELRCQTTLSYPVSWQFRPTHPTTDRPIEIFSGGEINPLYASEFKIQQDRTAGLYFLVIPRAKTSHSGEYICFDDDELSTENISIILTVGKVNTAPLTHLSTSAGQHSVHYSDSSSLVNLILAVLLFISISTIVTVVLHFTVCRKTERETVENITKRNQISEENPINPAIRMSPTGPAYEEVALDTFTENHTTEGTALKVHYTALIQER